jgi:hypothetical protein
MELVSYAPCQNAEEIGNAENEVQKYLRPLRQMLLPTAPSFKKLSIFHYIVTKTTLVKFQPNLNKTLKNVSKKNSLCPQVKRCIY